jgi:hypothetical protein
MALLLLVILLLLLFGGLGLLYSPLFWIGILLVVLFAAGGLRRGYYR